VIFADAALSGPAPFRFEPIDPDAAAACAFSTHALTPAGVLALARQVYGRTVPAYLLAIRGDEFDQFGERLSPRAQAHLQAARDELALRLTATLADQLPEHRVGPRCCGLLVAG
jgi:hydrogenase maturation protease